MLNFVDSVQEAVAGIKDGSTVMIGGFGNAGQPFELIDALLECGATSLTVVNSNAGQGDQGLAPLIKEDRVKKSICLLPRMTVSLPSAVKKLHNRTKECEQLCQA